MLYFRLKFVSKIAIGLCIGLLQDSEKLGRGGTKFQLHENISVLSVHDSTYTVRLNSYPVYSGSALGERFSCLCQRSLNIFLMAHKGWAIEYVSTCITKQYVKIVGVR